MLVDSVLKERFEVRFELHPRRLVNIKHVPGFIVGKPQVRADGRFQVHGSDHVFRAEERRRQVVVATGYPDFEIGIARHRLAEILGRVGISIAGVAEIPGLNVRDKLVGDVTLELEFAPNIVVKGGAEGTGDGVIGKGAPVASNGTIVCR